MADTGAAGSGPGIRRLSPGRGVDGGHAVGESPSRPQSQAAIPWRRAPCRPWQALKKCVGAKPSDASIHWTTPVWQLSATKRGEPEAWAQCVVAHWHPRAVLPRSLDQRMRLAPGSPSSSCNLPHFMQILCLLQACRVPALRQNRHCSTLGRPARRPVATAFGIPLDIQRQCPVNQDVSPA